MSPCVKRGWVTLAAIASVGGCRPALDDRPWLIRSLQIVGVKMEPPEVAPGAMTTAEVIAIGPGAAPNLSATTWSLCHTPKPLGENRAVAPDCLAPTTTDAVGSPVPLMLPTDACQTFGPNVPQPAPGEPPTRPRDPDATGGYYQPITTMLGGSVAAALERIRCGLPDASFDVARAFQAAYTPNQNPTISALSLTSEGTPIDPGDIAAGSSVQIDVAWSAASIETFPVFDRVAQRLATTGEILTASWYVTGGALDRAAAEVRDATASSVSATWTAPSEPGAVELLIVLRDSRGGADFGRATLVVR